MTTIKEARLNAGLKQEELAMKPGRSNDLAFWYAEILGGGMNFSACRFSRRRSATRTHCGRGM